MVTPLAALTTLRLGGPARDLVAVSREDELVATIRALDAAGEPVLVLGGGSNLLIADAGFDGTVVRVLTRGVARRTARPLTVAGRRALGRSWSTPSPPGLAGIECLSGIPGADGATPIQNVGAYGQDVAADDRARARARSRHAGAWSSCPPPSAGSATATASSSGRDRLRRARRPLRAERLRRRGRSRYAELAAHARRRRRERAPLPTCATRCSSCAGPRAWSWTPPTRTRSAPARSSPTRSWTPTRSRRRCAQATARPRWHEPDGRIKTLGGVADRARRLRARRHARARRHLHQAHARAGQPRRRDDRRARRAGPRGRRRGARALRRRARARSRCSSGMRGDAPDPGASSPSPC